MEMILRLAEGVDRLTRWAAMIACAGVTLVMTAQVFYRYVLNDSLLWSEEVSVWLMVWMVFLAAPVLMLRGQHVTVTAFLTRLPAAARPWMVMFAKVLTMLFLIFLAYYGWKSFGGSFHRVSPVTGLSSKWPKLAMPVGGALMAFACFASLLRDVIEMRRGNSDHFEQQINPVEAVGDA